MCVNSVGAVLKVPLDSEYLSGTENNVILETNMMLYINYISIKSYLKLLLIIVNSDFKNK